MNESSFIIYFNRMALEIKTTEKERRILPDKHQRIIDAAVRVFSRQGFYNSKVSDVAREADVADGTIYLYFKNKDDLLVSIFEHCMDVFLAEARQQLTAELTPQEMLQRFIRLHLTLVQKNQDLAQIIQLELRSSNKFMTQYKAEKFFEYLRCIEELIIKGQEQGIFRQSLSPSLVKRMIFGAIDELALEWVLMKKKRYTPLEAADQLAQVLLGGICEPTASAGEAENSPACEL